ncbi:MAG: ATP-binding protein [Chloroflexi bacterium]|nr:ATP-binding protein [Chloroflexota bacterium]MCL5075185.1 ATP-binding protein [Chloroflexota bacterium]
MFLPTFLSRMGLQKKIILYVLLGMALNLSFFTFLAMRSINESISEITQGRLTIAEQAARYLDRNFQQSLDLLERTASLEPSDLHQDDGPKSARMMLKDLYHYSGIFSGGIVLINTGGTVLLTEPYSPQTIGSNVLELPYINTILLSGRGGIAGPVASLVNQRAALSLTTPLRDSAGRISGVIIGYIDLTQPSLADLIQPLAPGKTGYAQIIDMNGTILASTSAERLFERSDHGGRFAALISERKTMVGTCHDCHHVGGNQARSEELLAFAPLSTVPWGVTIQQSEEEAFAPTKRFQWQMLAFGIIALLSAILLAWATTRSVVHPLNALTVAAHRITAGQLDGQLTVGGADEIGRLSRAFEEMRGRLKRSREEIEAWNRELENRVKQRTRELAALLEIAMTLTTSFDLETLFAKVLERAVDAFDVADAGALFLYDPEKEALVAKSSLGYQVEPLSQARLKPGEAIVGKTFQAGQAMLYCTPRDVALAIENMSSENQILFERARTGLRQPQSAICAPLQAHDGSSGCLLLINLRQPGAFQPEDLQLLQAIAAHIAIVLENARLLKEASQAKAWEEADRLKSEFLMAISHDLLTPLTSIKASTDLLLAEKADGFSEAEAKLLHNISRNTERLKGLVADLLDMAWLQSRQVNLRLEPLDLKQVIGDVSELFKPLMVAKEQTLDLALSLTLLPVRADRRRVEQILTNLLSNAHRYTPRGGSIRIAAHAGDGDIIVQVSDTGPGIPLAEREHIFMKFYRGRRAKTAPRGGTGLGLSIAKAIVELHGGRIWLGDETEQGTTIFFTLPQGGDDESPGSR